MPALDDFPYSQVAEWLHQGTLVPFLGAGASLAGVGSPNGLPTGAELAAELVTRMGPGYLGEVNDSLPKVAQYFERSRFDRRTLHEYIHHRFASPNETRATASVPDLLARIGTTRQPFIIVTTNYDTQVELAFKQQSKPLYVISQHLTSRDYGITHVSIEGPDGQTRWEYANEFLYEDRDLFPHDAVFLYKMHGSAHRRPDDDRFSVVITEDDYADMLAHCGGKPASYIPPMSFTVAFKKRRFLFLGYSLSDWNFRLMMRLLELRNTLTATGQLRHFAVQLTTDPIDEVLWRQRGVTLFAGDLSIFSERLAEAMGGL